MNVGGGLSQYRLWLYNRMLSLEQIIWAKKKVLGSHKKWRGIFHPFSLSHQIYLSICCIKKSPLLVFTLLICLFTYSEIDANIKTHANNGFKWNEFALIKLQTRLRVNSRLVLKQLYNLNENYDLKFFYYIFVIE